MATYDLFAQQSVLPDVVSLHREFTSDSVRSLHLFARQLVHSSQSKVLLVIDQFCESRTG